MPAWRCEWPLRNAYAGEVQLPFVIGVIGDFSGQPDPPLDPPLRFEPVTRSSFGAVMTALRPRVEYQFTSEDGLQKVPLFLSWIEDRFSWRSTNIPGFLERVEDMKCTTGFFRLEASWRSLHRLVEFCDSEPLGGVRVASVTTRDLVKDLEYDPSAFARAVTQTPFQLLIANYECSASDEHAAILEKLSHVAAAACAPLVIG